MWIPVQIRAKTTPLHKLSSLLERDESPPEGPRMNMDALISSPVAPPNTVMAQPHSKIPSSATKTPQTVSRLYPSLGEMHPSKVHQSTLKESPSKFHFRNIGSEVASAPSKPATTVGAQNTPSKSTGELPAHMISPSFDFSFERPESDLSAEAQKIMESVREEAAKIKTQMLEERSRQESKDGEANQLFGVGGRKINKPMGKAGRYSDVHKQEFKKMDSIAGHVSTWKTKFQGNASSLKRSPSKAGLDQPEKPLQRTKSFKRFGPGEPQERLEDLAPGKRAKQHFGDDISTRRPISRDTDSSLQNSPVKIPTKTGLPSAVTTPTKASLARSASVKSFKTSMIPSLSRSASTKTLTSPIMPKTEGSNKYASSLSRFGSMKSILHRSQPKFSNDPTKVAAGTHLPLPQGLLDMEKDLPDLPARSSVEFQRSPSMKRVGFSITPNAKNRQELVSDSPSPSKIPTPFTPSQPEISTSPPINTDPISYPDLVNSPNITSRVKIPRASTPGDFTFRAEKTINFAPNTDTGVTSPSSTIRHVRPSGVPTHVPAFNSLPAVPHGMPNKKRSRPDPDTETEDEENVDPMETEESDDDQPRAKKQRMTASPEKTLDVQSSAKVGSVGTNKSRIPKFGGGKGKGKKGISLGRLNMLARPKGR